MPEILIKTLGLPAKPLAEFEAFQHDLKMITSEDLAKLKESIKTLGFADPIKTWSGHKFILDGHQRITSVKELLAEGWTLKDGVLPFVEIVADTKEDAAKLVLVYNSQYGRVTKDGLIEFTQAMNVKLEELPDIARIPEIKLERLIQEGGGAEEDDLPEMPTVATTKRGELIKLGRHFVMCGDSTSKQDVKKLMAGRQADLVITSPPYNVDINYGEYEDKISNQKYEKLIAEVLSNCYENMKDGRSICWNVGTSPKTRPYSHLALIEKSGFKLFREIIWEKTGIAVPLFINSINNPQSRNYHPNYIHELLFIASKGELVKGEKCEMPDKASGDIWRINASTASREIPTYKQEKGNPHYGGEKKTKAHPAVFPLELPMLTMQTMTAPGETVLDPFGGSGTTLIAAEKTGRTAYIMEIDPIYCDLIISRYEKKTGQKATREASP